MRAVDEDDLKRLLEANSMESRRHFDAAAGRVEASAAETRRHFDVTAERLENKSRSISSG